jgi:hypothetical protein
VTTKGFGFELVGIISKCCSMLVSDLVLGLGWICNGKM